jgi:5'(3')-deoxyribonucleotidase
MRKTIAFDVDEVLVNFLETLCKYYNADNADNIISPKDFTNWHIENCKNIKYPDSVKYMFEVEDFYHNADLKENAVEVLTELSKDFEIFLVTNIFENANSMKGKFDLLKKSFGHIIDNDHIIFIKNKKLLNFDYLVDDGVHNLIGFSGTPLLFTAPHNLDCHDFIRLNNLKEVRDYFLNINNK